MKKVIVLILTIVLVLNVCTIQAIAARTSTLYSIKVDNGNTNTYSVIFEENEVLFSGEDLATITGFDFEINGNNATFSRGYKLLRVNVNNGTLYPLEDTSELSPIKFDQKVQVIDSTYFFPASELLPWMNVTCSVKDGVLCIIADKVSLWDFIGDFNPDDFAFDYIQCCQDLGENSKWLKTLAYIKANGVGMVLDMVPILPDMTYGGFMDYYELFDDMFKNKESVTCALEGLKDNNNAVQSAFDMIDELEELENLPAEIQMLSIFSKAFSEVSSVIDYASYYSAFYQDNSEKLTMLHSITLNRAIYEFPEPMVSAAIRISNDYEDIQAGIESRIMKAITEGTFDELTDNVEGLVSTLLAAINLYSATSPDWSEAIDRISKYDMISAYALPVYEDNKYITLISSIRDQRGSAELYLYACEQNWRAMAAYAHHKKEYALEQEYLEKAEYALEWQGKFLAASYAETNDSHAYGEGYAKTDYTQYLLSIFTELDKYDLSVAVPATLEELMPLLELIDSFFAETYGADVDWTEDYYLVYENEEACLNGDAPIAVKPGRAPSWEDTYDPVFRDLHVVKNFSSLTEWRDFLLLYMSPELVEEWVDDATRNDTFQAYDDKLYIVRGGRGYGACWLNLDTARLINNEDNKCSVTVDCFCFDYFECTYQIDFVWAQGKWIIEHYGCDVSTQSEIDEFIVMSHEDIVNEFIRPINEIYALFSGGWLEAVDMNQVVHRDGSQWEYVKVTDPRFAKYSDFREYVAQYLSDDIVDDLFSSDIFIQVGDYTYKMNDYGGLGSDPTIYSIEYSPYEYTENSVTFSAYVRRIKPESMAKVEITDNDLVEDWVFYVLEKIGGKWVFTDYTPIG